MPVMPAFRSSGALAAALLLSAAACTRTIQTFTPQGMVETQEAFLQYNAIRTQKDIYLSLADQIQFRRYFRRHRS